MKKALLEIMATTATLSTFVKTMHLPTALPRRSGSVGSTHFERSQVVATLQPWVCLLVAAYGGGKN